MLPVEPAAHYHMGGILTDACGRTSLGRALGRRGGVLHRRARGQPFGLELAAGGGGVLRAYRRGHCAPDAGAGTAPRRSGARARARSCCPIQRRGGHAGDPHGDGPARRPWSAMAARGCTAALDTLGPLSRTTPSTCRCATWRSPPGSSRPARSCAPKAAAAMPGRTIQQTDPAQAQALVLDACRFARRHCRADTGGGLNPPCRHGRA
jgi:hypothetical protein